MEDEYAELEEDNDLGYYADGTKRTLTDVQIAIFRHSEIQTLLRDRRHAAEAKQERADNGVEGSSPDSQIEDALVAKISDEKQLQGYGLLEDGELGEDIDTPITDLPSTIPVAKNEPPKKKGKKTRKSQAPQRVQTAKQQSFFKQNIKPDLRKRTWDKVDTGLESLDYDEGETNIASARPMQRKRIAYDDD